MRTVTLQKANLLPAIRPQAFGVMCTYFQVSSLTLSDLNHTASPSLMRDLRHTLAARSVLHYLCLHRECEAGTAPAQKADRATENSHFRL